MSDNNKKLLPKTVRRAAKLLAYVAVCEGVIDDLTPLFDFIADEINSKPDLVRNQT